MYNPYMKAFLDYSQYIAMIAVAFVVGASALADPPGDPGPMPNCINCVYDLSVSKDDVRPSNTCNPYTQGPNDKRTGYCYRYQCSNGHYYVLTLGGPVCSFDNLITATCPNETCIP